MEPDNLRFGGGLAHTVFSPVVALMVLIAAVFIIFSSRNRATVAFLAASMLIPMDQVLVLGPLHFPVLRILILFGLMRMFWSKATGGGEIVPGGMNGLDKAVVLLAIFIAVDGVLLWHEVAEAIFQLGNFFTAIGVYFLMRFLIRDEEDVEKTIRAFAYVMIVVATGMVIEQLTGRNLIYSLLGGAKAASFGTTFERDDKLRAMGPFAHPILAGTFGAIMLPLFMGMWWKDKKNRNLALLGMIASTVASVTANSSTSLSGYIGGIVALLMWPLRKLMRPIRWGILMTIISLHMVMNAPVWHLISRIDLSGSSASYHRYQLVNQCIIHFSDWWLVGTKSYADWGFDMFDLSNQYVAVADPSGLIPLILLIAVISLGFRYVGNARKHFQSISDKPRELFVWAIGAALFANVVAFWGISYFDQTIVAWYALLAMIPVVAAAAKSAQTALEPEAEIARTGLVLGPQLAPGSARGRLSK